MRKLFFMATLAMMAFVATSCSDTPSSLKGTWVNEGFIVQDDVQIKSVWTLTVSGSEETNAAGNITHIFGGMEATNENVVVNYSDGKGTFASADGSKKIEGTIKAEAKDELEVNLDENGSPRLRNSHFFKK